MDCMSSRTFLLLPLTTSGSWMQSFTLFVFHSNKCIERDSTSISINASNVNSMHKYSPFTTSVIPVQASLNSTVGNNDIKCQHLQICGTVG